MEAFPPKHHIDHLMSFIPPHELSAFINSIQCIMNMAKKHPHVFLYMLHKKFGNTEQLLHDAGFKNGLPSYYLGKNQDLY